jgi:hypothetical protein
MATAFIMLASETQLADESFAELLLQTGDNVARLVGRACDKFPRWGVDAGQVKLFLIAAPDGVDEPSADAIKDALSGERLQSSWPLERARIGPGSWLLARIATSGASGGAGIDAATDAFISARVGAALAAAMTAARQIGSFDPFARSHHSDLTSTPGSVAGSPTSQAMRRAFKVRVAEYYGLNHADEPNSLTDMFGTRHNFSLVTLAHIWPESYKNFADFAREMALPIDFHLEPRNYLLLPKDVHDAFDDGKIGFIPARDKITLRVFNRDGLAEGVSALDGTRLRLPREHEGRIPYKRTLGWFAWLAKGAMVVSPEVRAELEAAMNASASASGNGALKALVDKAAATSYKLTL